MNACFRHLADSRAHCNVLVWACTLTVTMRNSNKLHYTHAEDVAGLHESLHMHTTCTYRVVLLQPLLANHYSSQRLDHLQGLFHMLLGPHLIIERHDTFALFVNDKCLQHTLTTE